MRAQTKEVINSVQEILGYTELHPEVVEKILDLHEKVDGHQQKMTNLWDIVNELKGLSMWEIERMINRGNEKIRS